MELTPFDVLEWPDPRLRIVCDPVDVHKQHQELVQLLDRMWFTLAHRGGIGLAAPQVGSPVRVFIISNGNCKFEIVNPHLEIVRRAGRKLFTEECLSYKGQWVRVRRHQHVKVHGLDRYGGKVTFGGKGLNAAAIQHEHDHLDGINLADYDVEDPSA